jgi:Na+(H+)/acetate symporter ActP
MIIFFAFYYIGCLVESLCAHAVSNAATADKKVDGLRWAIVILLIVLSIVGLLMAGVVALLVSNNGTEPVGDAFRN